MNETHKNVTLQPDEDAEEMEEEIKSHKSSSRSD